MTLIDLFMGLPFIAKVFVGIAFAIWAFEIFCAPFRFNILCFRVREIDDLLRAILKTSETNSNETIDVKSLLSLLLGEIAKKK